MNKKILTLVALSISLCLPLSCLAQGTAGKPQTKKVETGGAAKSEPTADELKNSKERGLFIEQPEWMTKKSGSTSKPAATKPQQKIESEPKKQPVHKVEPPVQKSHPVSNIVPKKSMPTSIAKDKPKASHVVVVAKQKPVSTIQTVADEGETIITAWLNKPGNTPKYKDGEKMEVNVKASRDCNIAIYDYDGKGKLTQIFPNDYQQNSLVRSGETVTIGGADAKFEYQLAVGQGESKTNERIFIFAYPTKEAPLSIAMSRSSDSPFRSADVTPDQYRKLVNQSRVFFSREVKIVPKGSSSSVRPVSTDSAPNKLELSLEVEK